MTLSTVNAQNVRDESESVVYYHYRTFLTPVQGKIVFQDDLTIHLDIGEPGIVIIRKELIRKIKEKGENVTWEYLSDAEKKRRLYERPTRIFLTILGAGALWLLGAIIYVSIVGIPGLG